MFGLFKKVKCDNKCFDCKNYTCADRSLCTSVIMAELMTPKIYVYENEKQQADDKLKKLLPKTPEPEIVIEDFRLFRKR